MTLDPNSLASKTLAATLLLLVVATAWQFVVVPIADEFAIQQDMIERSRLLLESFARKAVPADELESRLAELRAQQGSERGFVPGTNTAMGSAALQATTKRIWEGNGGVLRSLQVLSTRTDSSARRVGVRVDGSIPFGRLLDLLYEFRAAEPYLFVDNLQIRVPETPPGATPVAAKTYPDVTLRAEIHGYMRLGEL